MRLQIPADRHRLRYVRLKAQARRHADGVLLVCHGPCLLARYGLDGGLLEGRETGGLKSAPPPASPGRWGCDRSRVTKHDRCECC